MIISLLTLRYTFSKSNRNLSHTARIIIGLALSTIVLLTVISVMDFLQNEQFRLIKDIKSFPFSVNVETKEEADNLLSSLENEATGFFYKEASGLIETTSFTQSINIRFIDDSYNTNGTTFLHSKDGLVASPYLLENYEGGEFYLSVLEEGKIAVRVLSREKVDLSGYFFTSLGRNFDSSFIFLPLTFAPSTAESVLALFPKEGVKDEEIISKLNGYDYKSWKEKEGSLYNAMLIEKWVMLMLLSVLFLIILVQVYHNSKTLIRAKQKEIASLLLLGLKQSTIDTVFFLSGAILSITGVILGTILSSVLIHFIPYFITLPNSLAISPSFISALILLITMSLLSGLLFLYQTKKTERISLGDIIYERN